MTDRPILPALNPPTSRVAGGSARAAPVVDRRGRKGTLSGPELPLPSPATPEIAHGGRGYCPGNSMFLDSWHLPCTGYRVQRRLPGGLRNFVWPASSHQTLFALPGYRDRGRRLDLKAGFVRSYAPLGVVAEWLKAPVC